MAEGEDDGLAQQLLPACTTHGAWTQQCTDGGEGARCGSAPCVAQRGDCPTHTEHEERERGREPLEAARVEGGKVVADGGLRRVQQAACDDLFHTWCTG